MCRPFQALPSPAPTIAPSRPQMPSSRSPLTSTTHLAVWYLWVFCYFLCSHFSHPPIFGGSAISFALISPILLNLWGFYLLPICFSNKSIDIVICDRLYLVICYQLNSKFGFIKSNFRSVFCDDVFRRSCTTIWRSTESSDTAVNQFDEDTNSVFTCRSRRPAQGNAQRRFVT